jgi:glycosyltransferase involved in cell wall biosynthesis
VLLPARLLRDKGVMEFLEAAAELKAGGCDWEFVIAGAGDYRNPSSVPASLVSEFEKNGIVKWAGYVEDIRPLYAAAKIVCLPSYREGMPKCLLEAAAAGCAVVTTDVPGCRDAIVPGETGDLVPAGDAVGLATTLKKLMSEPERIRAYAAKGRLLATAKFDQSSVVSRHLEIYDELMRERP